MSLQESNRLVMLGTLMDHNGEQVSHDPLNGSPGVITGSVYSGEDFRGQFPGAWFGLSYRPSENSDREVTKGDRLTIRGFDCVVVDYKPDGADLRMILAQLKQR